MPRPPKITNEEILAAARQFFLAQGESGSTLEIADKITLPLPFLGSYNSPILRQYPTLYGFSSSVIPQPTDWHNTNVTGYWFLDEATDWTPPATLSKFLASGAPPVYIGFGSMGSRNPAETADLVLAALDRSGQRGILVSGWGGLSQAHLPNTVHMMESVSHSWLFPRVSAVVHHGGAGTTAAGLRAGVPSIVVPFFGDQLFWGQRLEKLGVGTAPIPRKKLTVELLARAIDQAATDPVMQQQAANLGAKIQAEDGIVNAVKVIGSLAEPLHSCGTLRVGRASPSGERRIVL